MMRSFIRFAALSVAALAPLACTPQYPKCDKDEHCKTGEHCVNGQCQQCRDDKDCPSGQTCKKGRCEVKPGCRDDSECGPRGKCKDGSCVTAPCQSDGDCPPGQGCQQGTCVAPPRPDQSSSAACTPPPVYFDFGEHLLTSQATTKLKGEVAACIKKVAGQRLRIEGHCDPRGTEEYNLTLGDRRAQSVASYLARLGVQKNQLRAVSKGKLEATGTDEAGWSRDRRAAFVWEP